MGGYPDSEKPATRPSVVEFVNTATLQGDLSGISGGIRQHPRRGNSSTRLRGATMFILRLDITLFYK